ncbi:UNVERIFIED_CONTAM: putative inactive leucine-rich repeat receptor-like protein kinase [Sesamum radiatum]
MRTPRLESNPSSKRMENTMISMLEKFATRMSVLELCKATDGFSQNNVIAVDEVGTTYKAMLSNGWCLAIKRLISAPHIGQEFQTEILTLGRLRHRNLVPLVGFCYELNERISDFGKATIPNDTCLSREPLSREFPELGSYKRDVHCFGMVLLELITAMKYNEMFSSDVDIHMSEHISHLLNEQLLGISVQSEQGFYDQISHYLRIAGKCLDYDRGNLPGMKEVYQMLSNISRRGVMDGSDTSME